MKKNFFKKLSFVLALAMIVSVIAPAAGAFAKADLKLNATTKYLHLGRAESKQNVFNFNIVGEKKKGWTYEWSVANEKVAVVNEKNGVVTATGVGSTKVSVVITDKDGEQVGKTLTGTVVVRDNIKELEIYLQKDTTPVDQLKVGTAYDFGRKYKTESGSSTKTSGVTRWFVDNTDAATIDADTGLFKASEAGTYKITAVSFQSKAKYDAWKATADVNADVVTAKATLDVTVVPSLVSVSQVNLSKVAVEFDTDMSKSDFATKAVVAQIINGKPVVTGAEKIKSVSYDGKVAVVEMYANFVPKAEYKLTYGDLTGTFKAADTSLSEVVRIKMSDFTVDVTGGTGVVLAEKIVGLNSDGVEIVSGTTLASYLTYKYEGDLTKGYVGGGVAYIYTEGYSATVTATYKNYVYNDETKVYDTIESTATATATGIKPDTSMNTGTIQYALKNDSSAPAADSTAWGTSLVMAAKDNTRIWSRYKNNDPSADSKLTDYIPGEGRFTYTPSNTDLLLVSGNYVYAIAPGTVTIIVKDSSNNDAVVGAFDIEIKAARTFASAAADVSSVNIGNNASYGEEAIVKITAKDSMNNDINPQSVIAGRTDVTFVNYPADADLSKIVFTQSSKDNVLSVGITAKGAKAGAYNIKFKVRGFDLDAAAEKEVFVTVIVVEANSSTTTGVASWRVELSKDSVDLKGIDDAVSVDIDVYGYNAANKRVAKLNSSEYTVSVKKGDKEVSTNNTKFDIVTDNANVLTTTADNGVGTYVVTAYVGAVAIPGRVANSYIGATTLQVVDTTTKTVKVDTLVVSGAALDVAVKEAFTFNYNGKSVEDMTDMALTKVTYSKGASALTDTPTTITSGESVHIAEVEWTRTDATTGKSVVYKFTVGTTIKGK